MSDPSFEQPRPTALKPRLKNIPAELKTVPNWVLWKYEPPEPPKPNGKWRKVPYQRNGYKANITKRRTWSTFAACCIVYEQGGYDGVGFVFDGEVGADGYCYIGTDFDKCLNIDRTDNIRNISIDAIAKKWIRQLDTYYERSVSNTGFHCISRGKPLQGGKFGSVEIYCRGRYFTFTGCGAGEIRVTTVELQELIAEASQDKRADEPAAIDEDNVVPLFTGQKVPAAFAHLDPNKSLADGIGNYWYDRLTPEQKDEVVDRALGVIAARTTILELVDEEKHIGDNFQWYRLVTSVARSGAPHAEDIFVKHASAVEKADPPDALREKFTQCQKKPSSKYREITVATLLRLALDHGADFGKWQREGLEGQKEEQDEQAPKGVTAADFCAYLPDHNYIFTPTGDFWNMTGVNACLGRGANKKIDKDQPVHHLTWAPGHPVLIKNQLIIDSEWIERNGVTTFNLYRPPTLKPGDPSKAGPWLELVHKVYPEDAKRLIPKLAHRVQRPGEKINHAVVMGGPTGIGKDSILEPVRRAIGAWNFKETSPQQILGRFNGFLQSVIMRISEVRDLGEFNRYQFYEHTKTYFVAPPNTLRVDEKNIPEHDVLNCLLAILTTNRLTDGIYLPPDDRRHDVMWSKLTKDDFTEAYWIELWNWYDTGGAGHVAAYLATLDISAFNPKAPPPKTAAFWAIVDANRAPEEGELQDIIDRLGTPDTIVLGQVIKSAESKGLDIANWLKDRKNRRSIPHRLDAAGYVPVRNEARDTGLWVVWGARQVIYAKKSLSLRDQLKAATDMALRCRGADKHTAATDAPEKGPRHGIPEDESNCEETATPGEGPGHYK